MDRQSKKLEQLRTRYDKLKKKVRDWEIAVTKTEGRKPNKDDMKSAPIDIQSSYREFVKIRKYLETVVLSSTKKKNEASLTPAKIFSTIRERPLAKSVSNDDDTSRSTTNESEDSGVGRKRPFSVSPSPEKSKPKRKFFRLKEHCVTQTVFSWNPNKPKSKADPIANKLNPAKVRKVTCTTRSVFNEESMGDADDENSEFKDLSYSTPGSSLKKEVEPIKKNEASLSPIKVFFTSPEKSLTKGVSNDDDTSLTLEKAFSTSPVKLFTKSVSNDDDTYLTPAKVFSTSTEESLTISVSNDDDISRSTTNSSSHNESEDSGVSRKRPFSFALSPSPEKSKPKRKFFGSKENRATRAVFSWGSYRPSSPLKKTKSKADPIANKLNPAKVRKVTRTTRLVFNEESMGDADDENTEFKDSSYSPPPPGSRLKKKVEPTKKIKKNEASLTPENEFSTSPEKSLTKSVSNDDDTTRSTTNSKAYVIDIFDESSQPVITIRKKMGRRFNARNQTLDSKMSTGVVEDNYVRINTKKKVFVRGHRKINAAKMKRNDWKQRKSMQGKETMTNSFTCHKCGEKGHFAKFCTKDSVADEEPPGEQDDSPFPTLEEAARMLNKSSSTTTRVNVYMLNKITEETNAADAEGDEFTENTIDTLSTEMSQPISVNTAPLIESVDPFFTGENSSGTEQEFEIMKEGLQAFGYDDFRPGQREAIYRVLKGLSTLLVLSTGSGKSLCYQLPAYLYNKKYPGAMTLCISPLVSLMEDQVQGIPPFLNAACLHSGMTTKQKSVVLDKVKAKQLHILLVSPEAVCGGLFGLLKGNTDQLPRISFACIDEVHCVSQWSHNFRPSYLQLCKILREKLNVKTILGLTATATEATSQSICEHLNIDPSSTIRGELIPRNLKLSVSRDLYKDEALLNLLRGERFRDCDSIIIYCTRREECERIATLVRIKLQEISTNKVIKTKSGARLSSNCEAYHAGMTARRRKNVQTGFMSGDIRIVVATVAFGMGIDKSDIRAVIHYNMPSTFESYVQEIGRAGRDGLPAHCHLFLDNSRRNDFCELKRHVYANSVDRPTIRKLLRKVFQPCKCGRIEQLRGHTESTQKSDVSKCPGHEVSFSIDDTVMYLDLPKENITTLLCYLELCEEKWIEILPLTYEICKIQAYGGAKVLKQAASRCPPLAVAIALLKEKNKFRDNDTFLEFNVIEAAATVGWNSSVVKKELKNLEWTGSQFDDKGNPTKFRKSGLLVEFSSLAYRVKSSSLTDEQADAVLNSLHGRNLSQEQTELYQLQRVYHALLSVSFPNVNNLCDSFDEDKSSQLKKFIYDYFTEDKETIKTGADTSLTMETQIEAGKDEELRRCIRRLIDSNKDINFTTRSIARIFQGISSPCFPADVWYRNKDFWRRYLDVDFHLICRIAAEEL